MMPMEVGNLITTKGVGDIYIYIYIYICPYAVYTVSLTLSTYQQGCNITAPFK